MAQPKKAQVIEILDVTSETFQEIRELLKAADQGNRVGLHEKEGELILMDNIAIRCIDPAKHEVKVFLVYGGKIIPK
jgi:hypothetical protein